MNFNILSLQHRVLAIVDLKYQIMTYTKILTAAAKSANTSRIHRQCYKHEIAYLVNVHSNVQGGLQFQFHTL